VNGAFKRTLKVLDIMGFGSPIVSQEWIKACMKTNTFVGRLSIIFKMSKDFLTQLIFFQMLGTTFFKTKQLRKSLASTCVTV